MQDLRVSTPGGWHLRVLPRGWLRGTANVSQLDCNQRIFPDSLTSELDVRICECPSGCSRTNYPRRSPVTIRPDLLNAEWLFVCSGDIESGFSEDIWRAWLP